METRSSSKLKVVGEEITWQTAPHLPWNEDREWTDRDITIAESYPFNNWKENPELNTAQECIGQLVHAMCVQRRSIIKYFRKQMSVRDQK